MTSRDPVSSLFDPTSVAIIGASNDPRKRGYQTLRRLLADGFPRPIFPVHPTEQTILGLRAFPAVSAIQADVDLAFIVTPAPTVPDVLRDCGRKGVGAAVVVAVGFGETGEAGKQLEHEVVRVARECGVALMGPNTNGVFNLHAHLNLVGTSDVPPGALGLLCQSGNVGLSLVAQTTNDTQLGFSIYAGIGNEAGLRYDQLLRFLEHDDHTRAALVYAEGFKDGRAFLAAARQFSASKPLVAYKAGQSEAAQRSAMSHTGAIAGSHQVGISALRQAGVVVVERTDELVPVCETLLQQPALPSGRIAVLADGGGHATVAADALSRFNMELPALSDMSRRRLAELLPPAASTRNPVDVAGATDGDPRVFDACAQVLFEDPLVDGVLCVGLLGGYGIRFSGDLVEAEEQAAQRMADLAAEHHKALVVQSTYVYARPWTHQLLRRAGVPVHESVETAARCMAALRERGDALRDRASGSTFVLAGDRVATAERAMLTEPEARRLAEAAGIDCGTWGFAHDTDSVARIAGELRGAVAMKVVSRDLVHKSDVGGVVLNIVGAAQAATEFEAMLERVSAAVPSAHVDGVLIAPMAPRGIELIVGATVDPTFGPVLTVGAGGTTVEVLADAAFRAIPITSREAADMLDELQIAPLFDGYRGDAAVDRAAVTELMLGVSRLVEAEPTIVELDMNPVIVHAHGVTPVDVRIVVTAGSLHHPNVASASPVSV